MTTSAVLFALGDTPKKATVMSLLGHDWIVLPAGQHDIIHERWLEYRGVLCYVSNSGIPHILKYKRDNSEGGMTWGFASLSALIYTAATSLYFQSPTSRIAVGRVWDHGHHLFYFRDMHVMLRNMVECGNALCTIHTHYEPKVKVRYIGS